MVAFCQLCFKEIMMTMMMIMMIIIIIIIIIITLGLGALADDTLVSWQRSD